VSGRTAGPKTERLGLQDAALLELRSAAATSDYLRSTGDPGEFWEVLRLARSRRGLTPAADGAVPVPSDRELAGLQQALDGLRERFMELVAALRDLVKDAPGLPEAGERFEMALAFLLASPRDADALASWIRDPDPHRAKVVEKLRSMASVTDPYREALRPWSLDGAPSA
jgi:hypothetical protein